MECIYESKGMNKAKVVSGIFSGAIGILFGVAVLIMDWSDSGQNENTMMILGIVLFMLGVIDLANVSLKIRTQLKIFKDHIEGKAISTVAGLNIGNLTDINLKYNEIETISIDKNGIYIHMAGDKFYIATSDSTEIKNKFNEQKEHYE